MDAGRFDAFARSFSTRRSSRRSAIAGLASGMAATTLGAGARAQDATPAAESDHQQFLFVQLAEAGSWAPSPDETGVYLLTLTGTSSQTIFFSDRPQRIVGTVPTQRLFETLGFTPENAPNAAVVVHDETGERDVLVVELFDPAIQQSFGDDASTAVIYRARVLEAFAGDNLETWQIEQDDDQLDHTFSDISLFIDDCADLNWCNGLDYTRDNHTRTMGPLPSGPVGMCWNWDRLECRPCNGAETQFYYDLCNQRVDGCKNTCQAQFGYFP